MGKRGGAFILALVALVHFTAIFFNSTQAFHPLNGLLIQMFGFNLLFLRLVGFMDRLLRIS